MLTCRAMWASTRCVYLLNEPLQAFFRIFRIDYHTQEQQDRNLPFEPQPCQLECLGQHMECMAVEGIARCNCTVGYELVNAEVCQG